MTDEEEVSGQNDDYISNAKEPHPKEFKHILSRIANFKDRINVYYELTPLNFAETKGLIRYRLEACLSPGKNRHLFSLLSYFLIYRATKGYPRKMIHLCHQIILSLITQNKSKAGLFLTKKCITSVFPGQRRKATLISALISLGMIMLFSVSYPPLKHKFMALLPATAAKNSPAQKTDEIVLTAKKSTVAAMEKENEIVSVEKKIQMITEDKKSAKAPALYKSPERTLNVASRDKIKPPPKKPDIYGSVKVPENSNLSSMIRLVYGIYKKPYLDKTMGANPGLKSPEKIESGMLIKFPVIPESEIKEADNCFFIVFSENSDMNTAFQTAYRYHRQGVNVRILPTFDLNSQFQFSVIIDRLFVSKNAANQHKAHLPKELASVVKKIMTEKTAG